MRVGWTPYWPASSLTVRSPLRAARATWAWNAAVCCFRLAAIGSPFLGHPAGISRYEEGGDHSGPGRCCACLVIAIDDEQPANVPWTRAACWRPAPASDWLSSWDCCWPCGLSPSRPGPPSAADSRPSPWHSAPGSATTLPEAALPSSPHSYGGRAPPPVATRLPLPPWHCHGRPAAPPSPSLARCTPPTLRRS